jgi:NLI interacting factor-like phosphatase
MTIYFVVDVDETLGHLNKKDRFLLRPISKTFLSILSIIGNSKLIIWSLGDKEYIEDILSEHFPKITPTYLLTREHAFESMKLYKKFKHTSYLKEFIEYDPEDLFIGIDDKCEQNMDNGYAYKFDILPFKNDQSDFYLFDCLAMIAKIILNKFEKE